MKRKYFLAVQAIDLCPGEKVCFDTKGEVFTCIAVRSEQVTVVSDRNCVYHTLSSEKIVLLYDKERDQVKEINCI